MPNPTLPVVIIGAGPVGLAAAAHALERGMTPLILEAGSQVGSGIRTWSHVRLFSPWEFNVDRAAARLLAAAGWDAPNPSLFPTGGELVSQYLKPLAGNRAIAPHLRLESRVLAVTKVSRDRMKDAERDQADFAVRFQDATGEHEVFARAVVDASGTIGAPNPVGAAGIPALGERAQVSRIFYGIPDVLGKDRQRYAGRRVLVVGSGHSAFNVLTDLVQLTAQAQGTTIDWAVRRPSLDRILGGGQNDQLQERGKLGARIGELIEKGAIRIHYQILVDRIGETREGVVVSSGTMDLPPVDEIVAVTGFRPDLSLLDEVRVDLDAGTQSPRALAPLIDPNLHSCGTVRPHGAVELRHPDANLYIVGMKSYGRAPTFLMLTGYEQVRSVMAAISGDWAAASRVELTLPETGVCSIRCDSAVASRLGCGSSPAADRSPTEQCGTASSDCATATTQSRPKVTNCCGS